MWRDRNTAIFHSNWSLSTKTYAHHHHISAVHETYLTFHTHLSFSRTLRPFSLNSLSRYAKPLLASNNMHKLAPPVVLTHWCSGGVHWRKAWPLDFSRSFVGFHLLRVLSLSPFSYISEAFRLQLSHHRKESDVATCVWERGTGSGVGVVNRRNGGYN